MADFLLLVITATVFAAGWYCGKTFRSVGEACDRGIAKVKSWF